MRSPSDYLLLIASLVDPRTRRDFTHGDAKGVISAPPRAFVGNTVTAAKWHAYPVSARLRILNRDVPLDPDVSALLDRAAAWDAEEDRKLAERTARRDARGQAAVAPVHPEPAPAPERASKAVVSCITCGNWRPARVGRLAPARCPRCERVAKADTAKRLAAKRARRLAATSKAAA
ncbi:hypothetical protein [Terrabacter sp. Root181]|uniref:hypothetical protein n=1 Tax=Terrabacter sp. Root181 TaxID=1736484 RepID=UPI0006FE1FD6|nr:hypothetical protein [Terrabacter sp. Root181]KRB44273.1 hypothetical protein ASD90_17935 [Terrabacter sp. Root181]